jgi:hypothetical protein
LKKQDLVDGKLYRKIQKENFVNLMIYADGVKQAKSFKKECWPTFVGLCELPRPIRDSIRNKIICGVWIGSN